MKATVRVTGYDPKFSRISVAQAMQKYRGIRLALAKEIMEGIIDHRTTELEIEGVELAHELRRVLAECGVQSMMIEG